MYFITYLWRNSRGELIPMNRVLRDEHPLQWLARTDKADPNPRCRLMTWQKLTAEEAELATAFKSDP